METDILNKIHDDLEFLKREVGWMKEHMTDADTILTADDIESLEEAERELKSGKTERLV